jgi:hypothetical protein
MAYKNTDEYIASFSKDIQVLLQKIRTLVKKEVSKVKEAMIYGVAGFKYKKKSYYLCRL